MPKRSKWTHCYWCGQLLCHKCRKTSASKAAPCGGNNRRLCVNASTREHLQGRHLRGRGRRSRPQDIVVACFWCNGSRGAKTLTQWLKQLKKAKYHNQAETKRLAVLRGDTEER